jgi:hypothetical protein
MEHLITPIELLSCGLPISDDITDAEIEFAIRTIENYVVAPYITPDALGGILDGDTMYEEVVPTIKDAMYHLVFAYLMYDRIRLTRYSSAIKNDEHSTDPSEKDLREVCGMHAEIGVRFLMDVAELLANVLEDYEKGRLNGFIFNELLFG